MHLVIINCSPRIKAKSNTGIIIKAFLKGFIHDKNTAEVYHLSNTKSWEKIREAVYKNDNILMAVPLYVECVPGIMLDFLESLLLPLPDKEGNRKGIGFILHGGFPEDSQLRCGEEYLKMLPERMGADSLGVLIKGNTFITHMLPQEAAEKSVAGFAEMGRAFSEDGCFKEEAGARFAGPEYFSKGKIALFTAIGPIQKAFLHVFFKKNGCKGSLRAKPYEKAI